MPQFDSEPKPVPTEGLRSSGASPPRAELTTIHLLGAGKVGRAFLRLLCGETTNRQSINTNHWRVIGITDSRATVFSRDGLPIAHILDHKEKGRPLSDWAGAQELPIELALRLVSADAVVDATATDLFHPDLALARSLAALNAGSRLALAAKDALSVGADLLLSKDYRSRVGCNAALGGTGARLSEELQFLRGATRSIAIVANATTTSVIEAMEAGADLVGAIELARRSGLLEADPEQDFDGSDAAIKLAIAMRAVFGCALASPAQPREHLRSLDPELLRLRRRRGTTTRLVASATREGSVEIAYKELPRTSPLVAPADRVVYSYILDDGTQRVFVGLGVGPDATARALVEDVESLCGNRGGAK